MYYITPFVPVEESDEFGFDGKSEGLTAKRIPYLTDLGAMENTPAFITNTVYTLSRLISVPSLV